MSEACPRCRELKDEIARLTPRATLNAGTSLPYNVDAEAQRWLKAHPHASPGDAWRGGWSVAWSIARGLIAEWRRRWDSQATEISSLRSRVGVLLQEISRRDDSG